MESTYVHKNVAGNVKLISAVYNKDGSLRDVAISDVSTANAGERVNVNVNVNLALGDSMDGVSVKQFLWNDNIQALSKKTYRTANTEGTKIFLLGDSTVSNYDPAKSYPMTGWGQMLGNYLPNVTINNYATPGYTLKRTYNEGILDRVLSEGNPGDYVMLQFAHNDSKIEKDTEYVDAIKEYRAWLKVYAERVMAEGMNPIFVTSPVRRVNGSVGGDSVIVSYSDSMKSVGRALNVPVIDLFTESKRLVDCYDSGAAVDGADSTALYLYLLANDTRYFGEGSAYTGSVYNSTTPTADNTHFCEYGADVMAGIVAEGLENIGNELSDKVDITHIPVMP